MQSSLINESPNGIFEARPLITPIDEAKKIRDAGLQVRVNDGHTFAESIGRAIIVGHGQSHGISAACGIRVTRVGEGGSTTEDRRGFGLHGAQVRNLEPRLRCSL